MPTFERITARNLGTQEAVLYSVGVGAKALVIGCNAANVLGSSVALDLVLRQSAGDTFLARGARLGCGEQGALMAARVVLVAGDALVARASAENAADIVLALYVQVP